MPGRVKWIWRWGLVAGALVALVALAASLATPDWRAVWGGVDFGSNRAGAAPADQSLWFGDLVLAAGLLVTLTLVVANVLLASRRKRPLAPMNLAAVGLVLTLLIVAVLRPGGLERLQFNPPPEVAAPVAPDAGGASIPAAPAALPEVLVYGVSLLAAALVVVLGWAAWRLWRRPPARAGAPVVQQAALVAQAALADWQGGSSLSSVIVRCYQEMSALVAEKRAVQRPDDMTPREFVQRLEKAGVPAGPARQLTALFELARYSAQPLGPAQEAAARDCLSALAAALDTPA